MKELYFFDETFYWGRSGRFPAGQKHWPTAWASPASWWA